MVDSVFFPFQSQQEKLVPEFSRGVVSSSPSFLLGEEMDFQKKKKMLLGGRTNFPQNFPNHGEVEPVFTKNSMFLGYRSEEIWQVYQKVYIL